MDRASLAETIIAWYERHARDLPWRGTTTPWGVMVSEFMLQQTPVNRVLEPWRQWLRRWPTPAALASEPVGEAVRAWGGLGYPRRAQRLHAAATVIVAEHDGRVPSELAALRALPGVGGYTAAAIASFAFGGRQVVLDINVRRVLARLEGGVDAPTTGAPTVAEAQRAQAWLPEGPDAPKWSVAAMELGAQVCRAIPACDSCPVRDHCRWRAAGRPSGGPRRRQLYAGTHRAARGHVLRRLRALPSGAVVEEADLLDGWPDAAQARGAVTSLLADGLIGKLGPGYVL